MWDRIKLFYKNIPATEGSLLYTGEEASGYPVANLVDWSEATLWRGTTERPLYIYCEAAQSMTADYLILYGHNLKSAGSASVVLQKGVQATADGTYLADGSAVANGTGGYTDLHTPVTPQDDGTPVLAEFNATSGKYFRLKIDGHSQPPQADLLSFGEKTTLGYATGGFDPYEEKIEASRVVSRTGYLLGIYERYRERRLKLTFDYMDETTYQSIREWWKNHGLKNLFVGWNTGDHPEDVYLMRPEQELSAPFIEGGLYRRVTLSFRGRG